MMKLNRWVAVVAMVGEIVVVVVVAVAVVAAVVALEIVATVDNEASLIQLYQKSLPLKVLIFQI